LNAFSVVLDPPLITISTNHVDATASTPVTISNRGDASFFGIGAINLALGKHATQSSTYLHAVFAVAGYAVDGNTDGKFSNRSTASTEHEQGAWWQVDLGSKKNINQIIIHNRTDCCADSFNGGKSHLISIIWRINSPVKIILSTRIIHLRKTQ
jgi:hypothetical protein